MIKKLSTVVALALAFASIQVGPTMAATDCFPGQTPKVCYPSLPADLRGADLSGLDFNNVDFSGVDLTGANLHGAQVQNANFSNTTLNGITTGGLTGYPVNLPSGYQSASGYIVGPGVNLAGVTVDGWWLPRVSLEGANLTGATLTHSLATSFAGANLTNATFDKAVSTGADWTGADLAGATFSASQIGSITGAPLNLNPKYRILAGWLVGPGAVISGADFQGVDFGSIDLTGSNIKSTNLDGASLQNVTLAGVKSEKNTGTPASLPMNFALANGFLVGPGVDLSSKFLDTLDFSGLDFAGANLDSAWIHASKFAGANLSGASFNKSIMTQNNFTGANLSGAHLSSWNISQEDLTNADLSNAVLSGANVSQSTLTGANLTSAALDNSSFNNDNFQSANLTGANLTGANMNYCDFRSTVVRAANLTGTTFEFSNLSNQDFSGMDLTRVYFDQSVLTGDNLDGAKLEIQNLRLVKTGNLAGTPAELPKSVFMSNGYLMGPWTDLSGLDFTGRDLSGLDLSESDFTNANFSGANLSNTNLSDAMLVGANLTNANISGTNFLASRLGNITSSGMTGTPSQVPMNWVVVGGKWLQIYNLTPNIGFVTGGAYGQVLNVRFTPQPDATASYTFSWWSGQTLIPGQTGLTYTPTVQDIGKEIMFKVIITAPGFAPSETDSLTLPIKQGQMIVPTFVAIGGKFKVGQTLTAKVGAWAPNATIKYQWFSDNHPIAGAVKAKYVLSKKNKGHSIGLYVSQTAPGYGSASAISNPLKVK